MQFKIIMGIALTVSALVACKEKGTKVLETKDSIEQTSIDKKKAKSTLIDSFKQTKNEKAFLTSLYKKLDQNPTDDKGSPYRLIKTEEIRLHGSDKLYTLVYVDEIGGSMAGWPYKKLFILDERGDIKANFLTQQYEPVAVFENQSPLLMVTEETSKSNGIHHFVGIDKDSVKEYLNTQEWTVQTIDGNNYTPKILPFELKDINNDEQKDIIFTGKKNGNSFSLSFVWDAKKGDFEFDRSKG